MNEYDQKGTNISYWDERAGKEYTYKKEKFYTITPVPYYYARRKIVIKKIEELIKKRELKKICDFGCGDGEYIKKLQRQGLYFHGIDASSAMIDIAKSQIDSDNVSFEVSENGITGNDKFDMVYSSAVWAHIEDKPCQFLIQNIYEHLMKNGVFVICEQTAPIKYGRGGRFVRRSCEEYCHYLTNAGFTILNIEIIDFWLHRLLFEKHIVKWLSGRKKYLLCTLEQTRINLNRHRTYRIMSSFFTKLSIPRVFSGYNSKGKIRNRWGYCFIVAYKKEI